MTDSVQARGFVTSVARACAPRPVRNWLRAPRRSAAWVWNEARYAAGRRDVCELRPGWRLRSHPSAYPFAYFAQQTDPEQVEEFDAFIESCRPGMVLFDAGAHFGLFSLAALHYGGPEARAVALDPSPTAARMTRIQARLNDAGGRLTVVEAAVGDDTKEKEMVAAGVQAAGYFVAPQGHAGRELTRARQTTLDEVARSLALRPTHLKIDVEGDEAAALRGARGLLTSGEPPLVFLELHNEMVRAGGRDPREALALLAGFGYEVTSLGGEAVGGEELLRRPLVRVRAARRSGGAGR